MALGAASPIVLAVHENAHHLHVPIPTAHDLRHVAPTTPTHIVLPDREVAHLHVERSFVGARLHPCDTASATQQIATEEGRVHRQREEKTCQEMISSEENQRARQESSGMSEAIGMKESIRVIETEDTPRLLHALRLRGSGIVVRSR